MKKIKYSLLTLSILALSANTVVASSGVSAYGKVEGNVSQFNVTSSSLEAQIEANSKAASEALTKANSAYNLASTANNTANSAYSLATTASEKANSAYDLANGAYTLASSLNSASGSLNEQALAAYNDASNADSVAAAAQIRANSAYSLATTANQNANTGADTLSDVTDQVTANTVRITKLENDASAVQSGWVSLLSAPSQSVTWPNALFTDVELTITVDYHYRVHQFPSFDAPLLENYTDVRKTTKAITTTRRGGDNSFPVGSDKSGSMLNVGITINVPPVAEGETLDLSSYDGLISMSGCGLHGGCVGEIFNIQITEAKVFFE